MPAAGLPRLTVPVARSFVAAASAIYLYDLWRQTRDQLTNGAGRPFGDDFINYWSGAFLAWHGRGAEIYHPAAFHAFEQSVVGAPLDAYHYSYPPVLLLLTAPLAFIPYVPALLVWLAAGWFAFYRALSLAMPRALLLPLLAAALAHMTGLAFGPLFIVPMFVVALQMSFRTRPAPVSAASSSPLPSAQPSPRP